MLMLHRGHGRCFGRRHARGEAHHEGGHHHRGEGRRHGGRGGGRMFDHGELRLIILRLIGERPRHGYELIKAVEEMTGGAYSPSPGVVYPTLTMLEELGHATVEPREGGKKHYTITAEGAAFLEASRRQVNAAFGRVEAAREAYGGGPPPQVLRAMENLKLALRLKLSGSGGTLSEERIRAMAAAIDAAAVAVEGV
jgi:DNA-binding PadR family transcriptional regulator